MFQKSHRNQWGHHSSEARNFPRRSHYYHRKSFSDFSCSCHYPIWWRIAQVWFCLPRYIKQCMYLHYQFCSRFVLPCLCLSKLTVSLTLLPIEIASSPFFAQEWLFWLVSKKISLTFFKTDMIFVKDWYGPLENATKKFLATRCQTTVINIQFTLTTP